MRDDVVPCRVDKMVCAGLVQEGQQYYDRHHVSPATCPSQGICSADHAGEDPGRVPNVETGSGEGGRGSDADEDGTVSGQIADTEKGGVEAAIGYKELLPFLRSCSSPVSNTEPIAVAGGTSSVSLMACIDKVRCLWRSALVHIGDRVC